MNRDETKLWEALDGEQRHFACAMLLRNRGIRFLPEKLLDWTRSELDRDLFFVASLRALHDPRTARHLAWAVDAYTDRDEYNDAVRMALRGLLELRDPTWRINYERSLNHPDPVVRQLTTALREVAP